MKSIVLYFSYSGNTDEMAKKAADFTSSDICELKSPFPLSDDIKIVHDMAVEAKLFPKERNAIAVPFDHRHYSVFIIGSPLWLGTYPEFVIDYLKSIDWRGRKIFPFISFAGTRGNYLEELKAVCKGASVAMPFEMHGNKDFYTRPQEELDFELWLKQINIFTRNLK